MTEVERARARLEHSVKHAKNLREMWATRKAAGQAEAAKPMLDAARDTVDDEFARHRATKALSRDPDYDKPLTAKQVADADQVLLNAQKRKKLLETVTAQLESAFPPLKRCRCCGNVEPDGEVYEESFDGKVWCRLCAYGVLRTGHCTPHHSTHYLDIAAKAPALSISAYPLEVLHPFTREFFGAAPSDDEVDP